MWSAHDISVAVAHMPRFIEQAGAEVERAFPGTRVDAFGHLGDGNVHFHVRSLDGPWQFTIDPQKLTRPAVEWDTLPVPGNWDTHDAYSQHVGRGTYQRTFTGPVRPGSLSVAR